MRAGLPLLIAAAAAANSVAAQTLEARFLSEFRRVGAAGQIIPADSAGKPREINSPAIIRNGYTSLNLVVKGPPGIAYNLYLASNPDNLLRPVLYRVTNANRLEPVKGLTESGKFNEQGAGVYWLDIWTPAQTPVRRIRLEAQVNVGREFAITPLELRVVAGVVPPQALPIVSAPAASNANAASGPFTLLAQTLCGNAPAGEPRPADPMTITAKIMRNAGQDILLARKLGSAASTQEWCATPRDTTDPETYLRIRDAIWRASQ
jgi:hypothetical protein